MRESSPEGLHSNHTADDTLIIAKQQATERRELHMVISMRPYLRVQVLTEATPHRYGFCKTRGNPPFGAASAVETMVATTCRAECLKIWGMQHTWAGLAYIGPLKKRA